jgi:hypothetical protein
MDFRVCDKQLNGLGEIDECASVIWTIRYFSVGEVKILAPVTDNNKALLKVHNIVIKHDSYIDYTDADGQIWRRAAELTFVHITKDETGKEQIEARGYLLSYWLNQRVITPQLQLNDTIQHIVTALITKNVGSEAIAARQFPSFSLLTQADLGGSVVNYSNEEYKALGDEVRDQCQSGKLGYDIFVNERAQTFGFYLYAGRDLTSTGNTRPCIFAREFDNVLTQEFEDETEAIKDHAYVRGAADDNNVQMVTEVESAMFSDLTGLNRYETKIDATDISRTAEDASGTSTQIPDATYKQMLETRGRTELAKLIETYVFNSSIKTIDSNLTYKVDYDLGDRVTCIDKKWNISIESRITEITQTAENGKTALEVTFGESAPTLIAR